MTLVDSTPSKWRAPASFQESKREIGPRVTDFPEFRGLDGVCLPVNGCEASLPRRVFGHGLPTLRIWLRSCPGLGRLLQEQQDFLFYRIDKRPAQR